MSERTKRPTASSKKSYYRTMLVGWFYVIFWITGIAALMKFRSELSTLTIIGAVFLLMMLVPSIKELVSLFHLFDRHAEERNAKPGDSWDDPTLDEVVEVRSSFESSDNQFLGSVSLGAEVWRARLEGDSNHLPQIGESLRIIGRDGNTLVVHWRSDA